MPIPQELLPEKYELTTCGVIAGLIGDVGLRGVIDAAQKETIGTGLPAYMQRIRDLIYPEPTLDPAKNLFRETFTECASLIFSAYCSSGLVQPLAGLAIVGINVDHLGMKDLQSASAERQIEIIAERNEVARALHEPDAGDLIDLVGFYVSVSKDDDDAGLGAVIGMEYALSLLDVGWATARAQTMALQIPHGDWDDLLN